MQPEAPRNELPFTPHFCLGLVCDKALPATDFVFGLVRLLLKSEDALLATARDVCL